MKQYLKTGAAFTFLVFANVGLAMQDLPGGIAAYLVERANAVREQRQSESVQVRERSRARLSGVGMMSRFVEAERDVQEMVNMPEGVVQEFQSKDAWRREIERQKKEDRWEEKEAIRKAWRFNVPKKHSSSQ